MFVMFYPMEKWVIKHFIQKWDFPNDKLFLNICVYKKKKKEEEGLLNNTLIAGVDAPRLPV